MNPGTTANAAVQTPNSVREIINARLRASVVGELAHRYGAHPDAEQRRTATVLCPEVR